MSDITFLEDYANLNSNTEIPGIFALWAGLAGLSCALGRRVWLDMGIYTIFPNLYVCFVATSGRCRKSTSINLIEKLLSQLNPPPNLIAQKLTPEALIDALKVIQTNDNKLFLKESCVGFVIADELSTFLNRRTYEIGLGTLLIPLFDCKSSFTYHTRGRGKEILVDSCLGILAGTTIDNLKESIPKAAIGEGLTSRFIFVYCADVAKPVAITKTSKDQGKSMERALKFLQKVLLLEGKVSMTQDAWDYYEENYNYFYIHSPLYDIATLSGYASRRHTHLLKLAILFAISNRLTINVEKNDIISADNFLTLSEKSMPMMLNIITSSETGLLLEEVYGYIKKAKIISRRKLLPMDT